MSFEVFIQGEPAKTSRLPRKSDLLRAFNGHVMADESPAHSVLRLGIDEPGRWCDLYYDDGDDDPIQSSLMVSRPMTDGWLWDGLFSLLRDYDLFMYWPADPPTFLTVRDDIPAPDDFPDSFRQVGSASEIVHLIEQS